MTALLDKIPKKTLQGMQELQITSSDNITEEQRRLLVMIDGKKSISDLLKFEKIFGGAANLEVLRAENYIKFDSKING